MPSRGYLSGKMELNSKHSENEGFVLDQRLLAGLRKKDEASYRLVYKQCFPPVKKFVLSNNGNEADAQDTFQEALIVLYHKLSDSGFSLSSRLSTYLYSVSRLLWLKRISRSAGLVTKIREVADYIDPGDDSDWEDRELRFERMQDAMKSLGEPCRSLIEAFYLRELSMKDITERFGYSNPETAKNQKYKCLQRLKKLYFIKEETHETKGRTH